LAPYTVRPAACQCLTELNGLYVRAARCFQFGGRRSRTLADGAAAGARSLRGRHACIRARTAVSSVIPCTQAASRTDSTGSSLAVVRHTDHPCVMCPNDTLRLHGLLAPECQRDNVTADLVLLRPQTWCQLKNAFFASRQSLDQYIGSHWTDRWRLSCTGPVCSEVLVTVASTSRCRSVRSRPFSL